MKLLLSLTLVFIGTVAYAQNFRMVDTTPPKEVEPEIKYDSLTNMYPYDNKYYYKQFIGQSILFYPRYPKPISGYNYYGNFLVPRKLAAIDNITYRGDNKKAVPLKSYKAQHVKDERIALCALSYDKYKQSIYNKKNRMGNPTYSNSTGDFTPYNEFEGKTFRIINYRRDYVGIFTLVSEKSDTLYWVVEPGEIEDYNKPTSQRFPIIVTGYLEKMKQLYLNQDVYITSYTPAKKYKCTEIVYSGEEYQYMIPSLVLKGEDDELIIPLSVASPLLSFNLVGNDNWQEEKGVLFDKLQIMNSSQYEAKLEAKRLAKETWLAELEKDRLAKEQAKAEADRQREIKLQKRKALLCKKYGQTYGKIIFERKVRIGMTKAMCIDAWGKPQSINTSTGAWGVHEQWVYGLSSYLYFENGKLTSIQN